MTPLQEHALAATRTWVEEVVIRQNLCPFAARPYADEDVLLELLPKAPRAALEAAMLRAAQMSTASLPATTLLIVRDGLEGFSDFLAFQDLAETLLEERYPGRFVIASFHPRYEFANESPEHPSHLIHRSPYPIIQLLRQDQVAFAKTRADIPALLASNAALAARLGPEFFSAYARG